VVAAREAHGISERRARLAKAPSAKPMESQTKRARSSGRTGRRCATSNGAATMRRSGPGCVYWRVSAGGSAIAGWACF